MKTTIDISHDFLCGIEDAKLQFSFGLDNLGFLMEAAEDTLQGIPQKDSFIGALWCAFNQLSSSYKATTALVEAEYARLREDCQ